MYYQYHRTNTLTYISLIIYATQKYTPHSNKYFLEEI